MNDATKRAILAEIVEITQPKRIEEDEFTVFDYVEYVKQTTGEDVPYNTAASRLRRLAENGQLMRRRVQSERSSQTWAYRRVEE